jgi:hypothetical protein
MVFGHMSFVHTGGKGDNAQGEGMPSEADRFDLAEERLARFGLTREQWRFVFDILRWRADECAYRVLTAPQRAFLILLAAAVGLGLLLRPLLCLTLLNGCLIAFYLVLIAY